MVSEEDTPVSRQHSPEAEAKRLLARSLSRGRKGSFIQARRLLQDSSGSNTPPPANSAPTNEQLAQAIQGKVAEGVELQRRYKHIMWYSLFVASYLVVLYLQASAYKTGELVATLRRALQPSTKSKFETADEVMDYISKHLIEPTWVDPVCGDGNCDYPSEFPSYGRFGCKADCGEEISTRRILIQVSNDFVGHPNLSPSVLMAAASWNLCQEDPEARERGEPDRCWFENNQKFSQIRSTRLEAMAVVEGTWYIQLKGDYAGRVFGGVYDLSNITNPVPLPVTPDWQKCKYPRKDNRGAVAATQLRRLLLENIDSLIKQPSSSGTLQKK